MANSFFYRFFLFFFIFLFFIFIYLFIFLSFFLYFVFFRILNFPNDVFLFICYCFQKAVISIACLFDKMVQKPQSLSFVFNHAIVTNDRDIGFFDALLTSPFGRSSLTSAHTTE